MIEKWTQCGIGIIMIISPWVLGFSDITLAKWSNVLIGLVLVLMGVWAIYGEPATPAVEEIRKEKNHKK